MRVLHIDTGEAMQGGQWQVLYLLRGLRRHGLEQVLRARGELAGRAREEGFEVIARGLPGAGMVHVHDARAHTLAALHPGTPFVVSRRVGFPVRHGVLSAWKYRRAGHFIAVSRFVAGTLEQAGLKPERISVVYDGVPIPVYREPAPQGPVFAVMKDPLTPLLLRAAAAAGIEIRPLTRIESDLSAAGAFAYITGMQGLGSAAIAAMAAGVPVVASRAGGLPEIVEHERTGLLVENTEEEIGAALKRLAADRDLALRLSRQGYEKARAQFSAEAMVEGTLRVYERLVECLKA